MLKVSSRFVPTIFGLDFAIAVGALAVKPPSLSLNY
jgi:hypothetical protein